VFFLGVLYHSAYHLDLLTMLFLCEKTDELSDSTGLAPLITPPRPDSS